VKRAILAAALLIASPAFADEAMQKAANDFYAATLPANSGIPDAKALAKIGATVTPALGALLGQAASAEAAFMSANKDSPPMIEGDLFTSLFEGATSFSITSCSGDAKKAKCDVALTYDDKHEKPTHWTDSALLANTAQGWRVDDVAYGGSWDFGNKGRLTETLHQVLGAVSH
jgi:hypothetical protein